jgi:lysyl-tRNA synthetase class 2
MRKFNTQEQIRRDKLKKLAELKIKSYSHKIDFSHNSKQLESEFNSFSKTDLENKKVIVSISGRIMGFRGPFILLTDAKGKFQAYFNKKGLVELTDLFSLLDIGDIV